MKPIFTLLAFGILFCDFAISQELEEITKVNSGRIDQTEYSFWVKGEKANLFLNSMFSKYPKTKRSGYIHKFKHISVENILGVLDVQINEGVQGSECERSWFNTFENEKYRTERMERMTEKETLGIIIYVKKSQAGSKVIATEHEADAFCAFIKSLWAQ